jgi:hypothetical protein
VSVDALCLYRAGFGALVCMETLTWLPHARELFSSEGFHLGPFAPFAPPPLLAVLLCGLLVAASALAALGCWTRWALAATFGLRFFLYGVDQVNEKAVYTIVLVVSALLIFSSCGARYSFDDWWRHHRGRRREPATGCAFVQRLLQLQFAQIYCFAGLWKLSHADWTNGAVFARSLSSRWATDLGLWLSGWLPPIGARLGALTTILFELTAGFLLFVPRARRGMILLGLAFHLGIQATLQVGFLGPHFILALVLLFPDPDVVAATLVRLRRWSRTRLALPRQA